MACDTGVKAREEKTVKNENEQIEIKKEKKMSSTMAFAWFIWEKGYTGEPIVRWL